MTLQWDGKPDLTPPEPSPPRVGDVERWRPPFDAPEPESSADDGASEGWTNTLFHADAVAALDALRAPDWQERIRRTGGVKLIYLDPPFATGQTFTAERPIGLRGVTGSPTAVSLPAYRDAWEGGLAGYLTFMARLLSRAQALLADDGWLCVHVDQRASAYLRVLLDEICGADAFVNEIIWSYGLGNNRPARGFARKHDTLLLYAKSPRSPFFPVRGEVTTAMLNKYRHVRPDGTRFMRSYGKEYDLKGGKPLGSVWEIPSIAPTSRERRGYPTQKPGALLERLILATTQPGDLVLDPCAGGGTTLVVAKRLGRWWLGVDRGAVAISMMRERLLYAGAPFDLITMGAQATERGTSDRRPHVVPSIVRDGEAVTVLLSPDEPSSIPSAEAMPLARPRARTRRTRPVPAETVAGLDAVVGWAVAWNDDGRAGCGAFSPHWAAFREPPDYRLPLASDPLRSPAHDIRSLRLRYYLLDGTTIERAIGLE